MAPSTSRSLPSIVDTTTEIPMSGEILPFHNQLVPITMTRRDGGLWPAARLEPTTYRDQTHDNADGLILCDGRGWDHFHVTLSQPLQRPIHLKGGKSFSGSVLELDMSHKDSREPDFDYRVSKKGKGTLDWRSANNSGSVGKYQGVYTSAPIRIKDWKVSAATGTSGIPVTFTLYSDGHEYPLSGAIRTPDSGFVSMFDSRLNDQGELQDPTPVWAHMTLTQGAFGQTQGEIAGTFWRVGSDDGQGGSTPVLSTQGQGRLSLKADRRASLR